MVTVCHTMVMVVLVSNYATAEEKFCGVVGGCPNDICCHPDECDRQNQQDGGKLHCCDQDTISSGLDSTCASCPECGR